MTRTTKISVNGGTIVRDARTGELIEVHTANGVSRVSKRSRAVIEDAAARRHEALARLANR